MNLTSVIVAVSHEDKLPLAKIYLFFQHISFLKYSNLIVKYMVLMGISAVVVLKESNKHRRIQETGPGVLFPVLLGVRHLVHLF